MLRSHAVTVAMINRDLHAAALVRDYFDLPRSTTVMAGLLDRGLGQADLVLCLLRLRDSAGPDRRRLLGFYVQRLVGHAIRACPPCLPQYRAPAVRTRAYEDHRLVYVQPTNPRQPNTDAWRRWPEFQIGRTVAQLRVRGVTKRDLRRAVRRGWVKVEA